MKQFPSVENKENFHVLNYERILGLFRDDIYIHIIKGDENSLFDLDKFSREKNMDIEIIKKMANVVMDELSKKGWKCTLSYGDTALFIYSSDNPPTGCW
jgi:hypothetical protein